MVAYRYFIGMDVSKDTLDLSILKDNQELVHLKIANDIKAVRKAITQLAKQYKDLDIKYTLFCLEPTRVYNYPVLTVLACLKV
jgi:transposase